ncbi:hypothetical protein EJ03DRAFT_340387 [Teratosphaeria nubilosa]|uniref:UBA domain-containing protein n=1 Tax=Teratosphaeria nubilosa TaxID=161662 RepID=A0A6G1KSN3_9PEZI|nr:hypothetical protein EJ03DRAFT_340387 [Teratosphaeria nubilosa]
MASITVQPNEHDIEMFCAVTGRDRDDAVKYLRAKGGDLQAAVNSCIEGEDVSAQAFTGPQQQQQQQQQQQTNGQDDRTWDDTVFGKGKDYDDHLNDGTGQNMHSLAASGAPSRAPSRNSMHPTNKDEEDADMKAALELSMKQETGTIGGNAVEGATTGPQPKSWYENSSQALILHPTQSSRETIPDPDPEDRRVGETGEPRFLKHVSDGEYLAPFLTVCHAIAQVREAFLQRDHVLASYGQDAEWWKGYEIKMPRIVHADSGQAAESDIDPLDELLAECQRLMAFLDASSRSYASVAPLKASMPNVRGDSVLAKFMGSWILAAAKRMDEEKVAKLFQTTVCSAANDEVIGEHFIFDLTSTADKDSKQELTELLDLALWRFNEPGSSYYVGLPAGVITIKLSHEDTNAEATNVEAPTEFYIDKYLKQHLAATEPVRENIRKGKARLSKIDSVEKKLRKMVPSGKRAEVDALKVLESAKTYFVASAEDQKEKVMTNGHLTNGVHADDDAMETDEPASGPERYRVIADKLDKLILGVNKKLEILAAEKEKTLKAIRDATHTPLSDSVTKDFKHKYMLRGVSTKQNTTYVLCPKPDNEDEDMLLDDAHDVVDKDDKTPEGMQWWRIEYDVVGSKARVTKSRHADYEVTQAVALEHKEALLIYASDEANDTIHTRALLPDALQEFVKADNAMFDLELAEAARRREAHLANNPPAYQLFDDEDPNPAAAAWGNLARANHHDVRTSIEPKDALSRSGSMEHMEVGELGGDGGVEEVVGPPGYEDEEEEGAFDEAPARMGYRNSGIVQGSYNEVRMEDVGGVREIRLEEGSKSHGEEDVEGMS